MVETRSGRRFAVFFFVAAFLILFAGRWVKPVNDVALSIAAPFDAAISGVATTIGDGVAGVVDGPRLRNENLMLQREVANAVRRNIILQQQAHENQIMRRMLNFDDLNNHMEFVTARNIGTDPSSLVPDLIIDRGSRDGLRVGMTVVDQDGYFAGQIDDVASNAAKVLQMISPSSSVGATDLQTGAVGIVEGKYAASPQFKDVVTSASIRPGDLVVTSGQYNLFPRNLLIGQIQHVYHNNVDLFQSADIQPAASFGGLELVQVIRNRVPSVPARWMKVH